VLRFGTDGVRGDATSDLTDDFVIALGRAAARELGPVAFVVGRDTRESGPRIEAALCRGLAAEGAAVAAVGVCSTPGVAYLAQTDDCAGAVISASHNPWSDNGVKLFAPGGRKLPDEIEARIEDDLAALIGGGDAVATREWRNIDRGDEYVAHVTHALAGRSLGGLRVVLDCANGAASELAPRVFEALGATVIVTNASPDGRNINAGCGSMHPEELCDAVCERHADLGLALDGDADRVIAVDEHGVIVDGDQIMTALALDLSDRGLLRNDAIAVTVMSNLGLRRALANAGIGVVETPVGDRNVLIALESHDLVLGGEQSGHVILRDLATTGDGVLTGALLCDLVERSGRRLSDIASCMRRFPQVLVNVRVDRAPNLDDATDLRARIALIEQQLGDDGRVLVRASGTEPMVRVMVEATTPQAAAAAVQELREAVEASFAT
jgi:phosphoglucosamine mutase